MQATLRQQGGAAVLTVPMAILQKNGLGKFGNKNQFRTARRTSCADSS